MDMIFIKSATPQKLSITSSVIITAFTTVLLVISLWLGLKTLMLAFIPIIFVVTYLTTLYILAVLINDKITPIYKTIREVPIEGKKHTKLNIGHQDIIAEVNQEVKLWADRKSTRLNSSH